MLQSSLRKTLAGDHGMIKMTAIMCNLIGISLPPKWLLPTQGPGLQAHALCCYLQSNFDASRKQ